MRRNPTHKRPRTALRRGTVYLAVLGTALIASVLALSAIGLQRIQYHRLSGTQVVRQAQFNAESALELGLLQMTQNNAWRSTRDAQSYLFVDRDLGNGSSCDLQALDASTDTSAAAADRPAILIGTGSSTDRKVGGAQGATVQHAKVLIDPHREANDCLKPGTSLSWGSSVWQSVFDYYGAPPSGVGTQISLNSLPSRTPTFSRNPSLDDGRTNWTGNLPDDITGYRDADDVDAGPYQNHSACLLVQRNDWREGAANRLNAVLLKPDTNYNVSIEIYPNLTWPQSTRFRISLIAVFPDGTTALSPTSIVRELQWYDPGTSWTNPPITGTLRTPTWTQHPSTVYLVVNSADSGGTHKSFYLDNLDFYETNARFLYQTVLGTTAQNPTGTYWIDCQNNKLVIERSRIFGTLLVINPGPGSCIDYGPTNMSPAIAGYPALLVSNSNGNTFAIRSTPDPSSNATDDSLSEAENGVNYNPTGAPHNKALGTDNNVLDDTYDSEVRGLVLVSGNLTYANNPTIRGKVLAGGTTSGTATVEYQPAALLNPPPPLGVFYQYRYDRRPGSVQKVTQ